MADLLRAPFRNSAIRYAKRTIRWRTPNGSVFGAPFLTPRNHANVTESGANPKAAQKVGVLPTFHHVHETGGSRKMVKTCGAVHPPKELLFMVGLPRTFSDIIR